MAFVRWNQITNIWEVAATPENPSTAWNHLPVQNPTLPLDIANKAYVDSLVPAGGPFVPYNGANSNVNLAPYNLNAGRIVVGNVVDLGYPFTVSAPGQAGQLFLHTHSNIVHYYTANAFDSTVATGHRFYTRTGTATDNLRFMIETYYVRVVGDLYADGGYTRLE